MTGGCLSTGRHFGRAREGATCAVTTVYNFQGSRTTTYAQRESSKVKSSASASGQAIVDITHFVS